MASHGFWSLGAQNAGDNNSGSSTPRAWCQAAAQKFGGGIGSKLCALLNVGEMEKGADPSAAKQGEDPLAESCSCSDKPCICSKATVGFSHLYSTGKHYSGMYYYFPFSFSFFGCKTLLLISFYNIYSYIIIIAVLSWRKKRY
uniref:Uncharacterized protein n=1 Tax=Astyanax mexicanus TaxID=7994 RepID=A0A8B9GRK4_ASTMX